jgi:SAM-dependent methyltransferase
MGREEPLTLYDVPLLYDRIVPPGPCEAFYRHLARRTGGPILELACGTGRLTIPLALDDHDVVGLDASPSMLRAARTKATAKRVKLELVQGDMCSFDLGRRFPLVIVSCNSLAHLTRNEEVIACLSEIARHLTPAGVLAFDVVNPNIRELARSDAPIVDLERNPSLAGSKELVAYDPVQQVQVLRWHGRALAAEAPTIAPMRLRVFFPQEVPLLLALSGLKFAARYGDFDGNHFTGCSANQVCVAGLGGYVTGSAARPSPSRVTAWRSRGAVCSEKRTPCT